MTQKGVSDMYRSLFVISCVAALSVANIVAFRASDYSNSLPGVAARDGELLAVRGAGIAGTICTVKDPCQGGAAGGCGAPAGGACATQGNACVTCVGPNHKRCDFGGTGGTCTQLPNLKCCIPQQTCVYVGPTMANQATCQCVGGPGLISGIRTTCI